MREDFLHYTWKFKKFQKENLQTNQGEKLQILQTGQHNQTAPGPDFFNAKIQIGEQLWAGNVEIHLKSSDWYAHHHQEDKNYDNVILHVVWENDIEIYRKDNSIIPTLILKNRVEETTKTTYEQLVLNNQKWINCESDFADFDTYEIESWLERIFIERLEKKSQLVFDLLEESKNNWEKVMFQMLAKNFGLNVNGEAFLSMAQSIPFKVVQKTSQQKKQLQALLFGQLHLLEKTIDDPYYQELQSEYNYLRHKFQLANKSVLAPQFFRLRPVNFPSIRIAQLCSLYASKKAVFSELIQLKDLKSIRDYLTVEVDDFWKTHYNFTSKSKKRSKNLSQNFKDLLIINTIVPIRFAYAKFHNNENEMLIIEKLMTNLLAEKNSIVTKFNSIRKETATNALESQALIHLKRNYCEKNNCLNCNLGVKILGKKNA
ncbi:MAG: DUF2851 family protein [Bacteroidota bacterium]